MEPAADAVRRIMQEKGVTAYGLAKRMKGDFETNYPWLSRFLNGKPASLEKMHSVANALNVPIEEILGPDYAKNY